MNKEDTATEAQVFKSNGMKFPLDTTLLSLRMRRLLRHELYEEREFNAVSAMARRDDVVIELGAGMGYMSTTAAVKCKAKEVHAYEANPRMIPYIQEVYRLNNATQARVINAVLGPKPGSVNYYIRQEFTESSMMAEATGPLSPVIAVEQVPVLDVAEEFRRIAPTFLICDIEGAEADLLPLADLSTLRCAVIEVHPQWIGEAGVRAVFDAMTKAGLTYFPKNSFKKVITFLKDW